MSNSGLWAAGQNTSGQLGSISTVGTITTGTWNGSAISIGGPGGTGMTSVSTNCILMSDGSGAPYWGTLENKTPKEQLLDEFREMIKDKEHLKWAFEEMLAKLEDFEMLAKLSKSDPGMEEEE